MVIILVHWLIRSDRIDSFIATWKGMTIKQGCGLYREILTAPVEHPNPILNTFSITDRRYATFINIGMWKSVEDFDAAIRDYLPQTYDVIHPKTGQAKKAIGIEDFEFKIRERVVLEVVASRGGGEVLPPSTF